MNSNCKFSDLQKFCFVTFIYSSTKTRYYSGLYEKEISGGNTCEYCYIAGGDGLAAVYITENGGIGSTYYIATDHPGSINILMDNTGAIAQFNGQTQEYSFDACLPAVSRFHREKVGGRQRNFNDWSYNNVPAPVFTCRGFTGHEHLDDFKLINMSRWLSGGRMYDPYLGRFLSPDNYVQMPDAIQSFNRYSYALNNPLIYTDPDGEFAWAVVIIGAWIGGMQGLNSAVNKANEQERELTYGAGLWGWFKGAFAGAVSGTIGQFGGGTMLNSVLWGAGSGAISGGLFAWANNKDILTGMKNGAIIGGTFAALQSGFEVISNGTDYGLWNTNDIAFDRLVDRSTYMVNGIVRVDKNTAQEALDFWTNRFGGPQLTYYDEGWYGPLKSPSCNL